MADKTFATLGFTGKSLTGHFEVEGGIDYLVGIAQKVIRSRPQQVTFIAPYVSWLFSMGAGALPATAQDLEAAYEQERTLLETERDALLAELEASRGRGAGRVADEGWRRDELPSRVLQVQARGWAERDAAGRALRTERDDLERRLAPGAGASAGRGTLQLGTSP